MKKILEGRAITKKTVSGKIMIRPKDAIDEKEPFIFFAHHTTEDIFDSLHAAKGIVTTVGGTLSHASIVIREFDKAGLIQCDDLQVNKSKNHIKINGEIFKAGTMVCVDGFSNAVYLK